MYTDWLKYFDFQICEEFYKINHKTYTQLRDAWHRHRDRIMQLACEKSATNADLRAITDTVMDQYDEGSDFQQHYVISHKTLTLLKNPQVFQYIAGFTTMNVVDEI
jgi:hypothetical protein